MDSNDEITLRNLSLPGIILALLFGTIAVIAIAVMVFVEKPKAPNAPIFPGVEYVVIGVSIVLCIVGVILVIKSPIAMRLTSEGIEFPAFDVATKWSHIKNVKVAVGNPESPTAFQTNMMMFRLTEQGAHALGDKKFYARGMKPRVSPKPHICVKGEFMDFGPHDTLEDLIQDIRSRAKGNGPRIENQGPVDLKMPLVKRKKILDQRVYVHSLCKNETIVSGNDFKHLCNPLQFCLGTICVHCGESALDQVRWSDTGERVSTFRSRMFRNTPIILTLLQFVVLPSLLGIATIYLFDLFKPQPGLPWGMFPVGYIVGVGIITATPFGQLIPIVCGRPYWQYK